jgi:hypothetical protein
MAKFEMPTEMLLKDAIGDGGRLLIDYHIGVAHEEFRAAVAEGVFTDKPVLFVDGRQKKGISGLKFGGKLEFVDSSLGPIKEAVELAVEEILHRAVVKTGRYVRSFVMEINGTKHPMTLQPDVKPGDVVNIYPEEIPYAAKLELVNLKEDGVVYGAWKLVSRKYKQVLGVKFSYPAAYAADYTTKDGQARARNVPVLTIGAREDVFTSATKPGTVTKYRRKGGKRGPKPKRRA